MEYKFDLHMHSRCSDGSETPAGVVRACAENGVSLMALTDHDCMAGVAEAQEAGRTLGLPVLAGVEFDCDWEHELHILGLNVRADDPALVAALALAGQRRNERNAVILERLRAAGFDIAPYMPESGGTVTRQHFALGLVNAGFATDLRDAFTRYLEPGQPGYYRVKRLTPEEVITVISGAGGTAVWAHPAHKRTNIHKMTDMLAALGLAGLEAYHPSATPGESELIVSLAAQYDLLVTCGSDFHGSSRPAVTPGCTWCDTAPLRESYAFFLNNRPK